MFRQCSELLGVHQMRTTPLHPQSDGMVERFKRTLAEELAKYCSSDQQPVVAVYLDGIPVSAAGGYRLHSRQDDVWSGDAAATGRPPGEELPQTAPEFVVALQQQMEATRRATFASLGKP